MGYRNCIYVIDKVKADKFRKKSFKALEDNPNSGHIDMFNILSSMKAVCAHELGKEIDAPIKEGLTRFFKDDRVHEALNSEYEFMLLNPDHLKVLANFYKNKVINANKRLLMTYENDEIIGGKKLYENLKYKTSMMTNLDQFYSNKYCLVDTWLWEFDLLNFLYLLKTVDFDKYYLLWLGW